MIFRALTPSGDWSFGSGIAGYAINEQAVELNIQTRLASWVGDCFFDLQAHVDWFARINLGQQQNLQDELRSVILRAYGVVSVDSVTLTLNRQTRQALVTYKIRTLFSPSVQKVVAFTLGLPVAA